MIDLSLLKRSGPARGLFAAGLAFLFYGGWAYLVNSGHTQWIALRAGLVQGGYSFLLTLLTTALLEFLYRSLQSVRFRASLTLVICTAFLTGTGCLIHWLIGTPEILYTILPGFILGTAYAAAYVRALHSLVEAAE